MPYITFEKEGKTVCVNAGMNLRKVAKANKIELYSGIYQALNCRGNGLCGSCQVEITKASQIHPRTLMEDHKLSGIPSERRLACQVVIHGDMTIHTRPVKWVAPPPETKDTDS